MIIFMLTISLIKEINYLRAKISLDKIQRWIIIKTEPRHGAFCLRRNLGMIIDTETQKWEILVLYGKTASGSNSVSQV